MPQPYGQNFLKSTDIARKIVSLANVTKEDNVVEIGPGRGILSSILAEKSAHLTVIEIDRKLMQGLNSKFSVLGNVKIFNGDFVKFDLSLLGYAHYKVVANLPYCASSAILEKLLPSFGWTEAVVMVQRELANRIVSPKDKKTYGYFTLFARHYADVEVLLNVPKEAFNPPPKVESTVIRLRNKQSPLPINGYFKLIKAAFSQRRKTILNSISSGLGIEKPLLLTELSALQIPPNLRPENLSDFDFQALTLALKKYIIS